MVPPAGARVCVLPFRERREYVPVGSLSNVLFSRVPEGQNTDPLRDGSRRYGSSLTLNLSAKLGGWLHTGGSVSVPGVQDPP